MSESRFQFEIVIVGAGPAGLSAACTAAESGKKVAIIDNTPWLGGQVWRGEQARPSLPLAQGWLDRFSRSGATLLDQTTVIARLSKHSLLAEHSSGPREITWQKLVLATGARELFLPFPGWTLPGVMGQGGLLSLVKNGWPVDGKKIVLAGTGPLLLAAADGLKKYGANVVSIAEQAPSGRLLCFGLNLLRFPGKVFQGIGLKARLFGVPSRYGVWPVRANGTDRVQSVELTDGQRTWTQECDILTCGFHLVPNLELPALLACDISRGFVRVDEFQGTSVPDIFCAGEPTGIGGVDCALIEGQIAGYAAGGQPERARTFFKQRAAWHSFRTALAAAFSLRPELKKLADDETILCRCEDVTMGRVKSFPGWRQAKLQTRCGMGACQGRTCGTAAQFILGWGMESVRPPVLPAHIGSLLLKK